MTIKKDHTWTPTFDELIQAADRITDELDKVNERRKELMKKKRVIVGILEIMEKGETNLG